MITEEELEKKLKWLFDEEQQLGINEQDRFHNSEEGKKQYEALFENHPSCSENLNISDVIKHLSQIQRYNMVEGGNNIHRIIQAEKNDNGEWIHYSVIDEITKMLKQINVL